MRLIDADALAERFVAMQECASLRDHIYLMGVLSMIDNTPTIDTVPVVHARWIHDGPAFRGGVDWWRCSICGNMDSTEWMRYCPTCGAKMDGGDGA